MNSFCSYYNQKICQSCRFIELPYPDQLKQKEQRLKAALSSLGDWRLLPTISSHPQGFRNKAKMSVTGNLSSPIIGLYGEEDLDAGREIRSCPVHHPQVNEILGHIPDFIRLAKLAPYQIEAKQGELKGLILYYSEGSNQSYLRFVLRSKEALDRIKKHLPFLISQVPSIKCVSANIQPIPHAILEGEEEVILTEATSIDHLGFRLGPKGFVQTNQGVAHQLYATAASWVAQYKLKRLVELYCGQGAFSFYLSPFLESSVGFEINPDAVKEANATAHALDRKKLLFKCADAGKVGEEVKSLKPDLILVNPPRRGLVEGVHLLKERICPYVIYSSCSLESLKKDLEELSDVYEIKQVQLFDMFPHTEHFETLVLLEAKL